MKAATVTPEQIEAAQQFNNQLVQLAASSDYFGQRLAEVKKGLEQAFENFFTQGITQANDLGDAFRSLAQNAVGSLQQILAQMLSTMVVAEMFKSVLGLAGFFMGNFGPGGIIGPDVEGNVGAAPVGAAEGGLVRGPGTGTSDSIPARLSAGEYVMPASVVAMPGKLEILEGLRAAKYYMGLRVRDPMRIRGYSTGGLVEANDRGAGKTDRTELHVGLSPEMILEKLTSSSKWDRVFLKTLNNNRKGAKALMR